MAPHRETDDPAAMTWHWKKQKSLIKPDHHAGEGR